MRKNRRVNLKKGMACCLAAVLLGGCGSSVQTEEQIVVSKEAKQAAQIQAGKAEITGGIQEQVQAPERLSDSIGSETVSIRVDAPVIVPEAEGFRIKKVKSRVFTQEDYDLVNKVLLDGSKLYERDEAAMEASNGATKTEIEEQIALLEAERASGVDGKELHGGMEINYDELIGQWKSWLKAAPDEAVFREVPAVVNYQENGEDSNYLTGKARTENGEYDVTLMNDLRNDWRWISFQVVREDIKGNFLPVNSILSVQNSQTEEKDSVLAGMKDEIQKSAKELAVLLGMEEFVSAGGEYFAAFSSDERQEEGDLTQENVGYGIHFTRTLDGIPVTYTSKDGNTSEGVQSAWPYESLTMVYDQKGLADFIWENPYQVEDLSEDYVFLLPFSEIWKTAGEMLLKKSEEDFGELGWEQEFKIEEIRLGYMRIMEKGNPMEGTMLPVWDFFGSRSVDTKEEERDYTEEGPFESWITINAMDGTVINRDYGY